MWKQKYYSVFAENSNLDPGTSRDAFTYSQTEKILTFESDQKMHISRREDDDHPLPQLFLYTIPNGSIAKVGTWNRELDLRGTREKQDENHFAQSSLTLLSSFSFSISPFIFSFSG